MKLLHDAIELMEDNLFQDYSVEKLSKDLHYSKYHLSREFNTKIGMSIPMYTKLRRMTESDKLIPYWDYFFYHHKHS
jgi:AraC-like DNA-binding protein